jgi:hypothetical protein
VSEVAFEIRRGAYYDSVVLMQLSGPWPSAAGGRSGVVMKPGQSGLLAELSLPGSDRPDDAIVVRAARGQRLRRRWAVDAVARAGAVDRPIGPSLSAASSNCRMPLGADLGAGPLRRRGGA